MSQLEAIVDGFAAGRQKIESRLEQLVTAEFSRAAGWYAPQQVKASVKAVAGYVSAGQLGVAQLTDAYLIRATSYVVGKQVVGGLVPSVMGQTLRMGVADHEAVYARVAAEYRYQRSLGLSDADALSAALTRAREMVSTDLGLAFQRQSQRFMDRNRISYYRRVVRPELSASGSCGLCVAASDRLYRKKDLLPIHARCKCVTVMVTANTDPGSQLNEDSLAALYADAGSTSGKDLKRTRVTVFHHPELGPQLRVAGQHARTIPTAA